MGKDGPILPCLLEQLPPSFVSPSQVLHHFTGKKILGSIVSSGEVWMTRYDRMCNDRREGGYILDLYGDVIGSMESEGTVPGDFLKPYPTQT